MRRILGRLVYHPGLEEWFHYRDVLTRRLSYRFCWIVNQDLRQIQDWGCLKLDIFNQTVRLYHPSTVFKSRQVMYATDAFVLIYANYNPLEVNILNHHSYFVCANQCLHPGHANWFQNGETISMGFDKTSQKYILMTNPTRRFIQPKPVQISTWFQDGF